MKTLRLLTSGILMSAIISCQQDSHEDIASFQNTLAIEETTSVTGKANADAGPCNPGAYEVILDSRTLINGNWEWVWSVRNLNPGNGNNGTAKDLSHWGLRLATCVTASSIIDAGYSADASQWTSFTPVIEPDPSQDCLTTPTLKFDYGTTGTAKSYYRLLVSGEYTTGNTLAYYKAGSNCCTFNVTGMSCSGDPVEIVE